jgi:phage gpG-like protein
MIRLEGVGEFKAAVEETIAKEQAATRRAVSQGAHLIERKAKELLSISGAGAQSRDSKGRFTARQGSPSAPGDPPHLQSGNLRRSITVDGPNEAMFRGYPGWQAEIGPTAIYGRIQELGGITWHAILPARPYMTPAYDDVKPLLRPIFVRAWRDALML